MANRRRNLFLTVGTVLMSLTSYGNGAYEQCLTSLRNTVVYEGTQNTLLGCANGPNGTAWAIRPTSRAANSVQITNFNDTVDSTLSGLYANNETGLVIRKATATPTDGTISTAGIYYVEFSNSTSEVAAKFVVIRSGPDCSCTLTSSFRVQIQCMFVYADSPTNAVNAILNCTADSQLYVSATATRTLIPYTPTQYVWNSTSTITVNNTGAATYDCVSTFAAPIGAPSYLAKNAPDFRATSTVFCGSTTTALPTTTTQTLTTIRSSSSIATQQQPTTTSLLTTSEMHQTVPTQPITSGPTRLLSMKVVLCVVFGCLFLATVVCCCWCCQFYGGICGRRFRRQPRYIRQNSDRIGEDSGFWGRRYILRYRGTSTRHNQLSYCNQALY